MAHALATRSVRRVLLCRPTYFTVDYIINPYMQPYAVDAEAALKQWEDLVALLESLDIKVEVIEQQPDVPDMVFAADQGIVQGNDVLLANFRFSQRQKERIYYRDWFRDQGFNLRALSNLFPFEACDTLFVGSLLLVGTGFRANVASCEELAQKLSADVIPLRLVDPHFYHLDIALLPIDEKTAFYYPPAFTRSSQNLLKRIIPNLYELSQADVEGYAANAFVSGKDIVVPVETSPELRVQLTKLGMRVHEVDVSEFKKAGGGIHCLINVLE